MNVWGWVNEIEEELTENGEERLAYLLYRFPTCVVEHQFDQVEALYPEINSLVARTGNKWLKIFFDHWYLQALVGQQCRVNDALPRAVALLEYSHRNDTKQCPQSVCATQDLSICYAMLDGPGFAAERMAVIEESLSRITPAWDCYTCMVNEYCDALYDIGEMEKLHDYARKALLTIESEGNYGDGKYIRHQLVRSLIALGKAEDAFSIHKKFPLVSYDSQGVKTEAKIDEALIQIALKNYKAAESVIPPFSKIMGVHKEYPRWGEAQCALAAERFKSTGEFSHLIKKKLIAMVADLWNQGAYYIAWSTVTHLIELEILQGVYGAAHLLIEFARNNIVPSLRNTEGYLNIITKYETTLYQKKDFPKGIEKKTGEANPAALLKLMEKLRIGTTDSGVSIISYLESQPSEKKHYMKYGFSEEFFT